MPLYDIRCADCGIEGEVFRKIDERHDLPACGCGGAYEIVIRPPMVVSDIEPYRAVAIDVATGKAPVIGSRAEHREYLKRNGFVEVGNERPKAKPAPSMPPVANDLKRAIDQVKTGQGAKAPTGTGVNIFGN